MVECMAVAAQEVKVDGLEHRIAVVCGHLNACHGQLLDLVIETLTTDGWHGWGFRSPEHWVALRTGFSPARSRQLVLLARRAAALPVTVDALRSGRLSLDQAVVVAQAVPAHNDAEACELAAHLSVSQLRHALLRYQFDPAFPPAEPDQPDPPTGGGSTSAPPPDPSPAEPAEPAEPLDRRLASGELSFFFDEHGRFQLRLDAPLDDGLIIESALREARDALFRSGRTAVTWMDAFNEICRRSLASNGVTNIGASRSDRFRIYIHLDTEGGWVNGNVRVPQTLLDQIMSDGIVRPVWTTNGKPVNVGRATKVISPAMRRLVLHRDGHRCRTPGCDSTLDLEVHHVRWFGRDHGPTDTWNLAAECGACHHHIHRGHFHATGNADEPDGLVFTDSHGRPLVRHPTPIPPTGPPPAPDVPYIHPGGARLDSRWLWFRPPPPPPPAPRPPPSEAA